MLAVCSLPTKELAERHKHEEDGNHRVYGSAVEQLRQILLDLRGQVASGERKVGKHRCAHRPRKDIKPDSKGQVACRLIQSRLPMTVSKHGQALGCGRDLCEA